MFLKNLYRDYNQILDIPVHDLFYVLNMHVSKSLK